MSQHHARMGGRKRQQRNRKILAASDVCHICGHAGSDAVDHVKALARARDDAEAKRLDTDPTNLRPAHHDAPCPTCGRRCNREKGAKDFAPIIRRSGSLKRPGGPVPPTAP